jgi:hypothetical protein
VKRRDDLADLGIDVRIILKCIVDIGSGAVDLVRRAHISVSGSGSGSGSGSPLRARH